jgi:hypothetical protein
VYLRARSLDPGTGRLLSADSVFPNAPGTQGYNLYAYVANNPATWLDPTGHSALVISPLAVVIISIFLLAAFLLTEDWFREMWLESASAAFAALAQALKATPFGWTIEKLKEWWQREPEKPRPVPCIPQLMPICTPGDDDQTEVLIDTGAVYSYKVLVPLLESRGERGVISTQVQAELLQNDARGKPRYPNHPFPEVPDVANFVAMARMRQQYFGRNQVGDEGDIIIGTTAISSGRLLYSSDPFLVGAVTRAGGRAQWVP